MRGKVDLAQCVDLEEALREGLRLGLSEVEVLVPSPAGHAGRILGRRHLVQGRAPPVPQQSLH